MTAHDPERTVWAMSLVLSATFSEVNEALADVPKSLLPQIASELDQDAEKIRAAGAPQAAELCAYLATRCRKAAETSGAASGTPAAGASDGAAVPEGSGAFLVLLRRAAAERNLLAAHRMLSRGRELFPARPAYTVLNWLLRDRAAPRTVYAPVLGALGLLAHDSESEVIGRAEWAVFLSKQGRFARAKFHATRAVTRQMSVGGSNLSLNCAFSALAMVLRDAGLIDECLRVSRDLLVALEHADDVEPTERIRAALQYASDLQRAGNHRSSIPVLAEARRQISTVPAARACEVDALWLLGSGLRMCGAYDNAVQALWQALAAAEPFRKHSMWFKLHVELSFTLLQAGRRREAQRMLRECIAAAEREPSAPLGAIYNAYARTLILDGQYPAARYYLQRSIVHVFTPSSGYWLGASSNWIALGDIALRESKPELARRHFQEALEREPRHSNSGTKLRILAQCRMLEVVQGAKRKDILRALQDEHSQALEAGDLDRTWIAAEEIAQELLESQGKDAWEVHWRRLIAAYEQGESRLYVTAGLTFAEGLARQPGRAAEAFALLMECRKRVGTPDTRDAWQHHEPGFNNQSLNVYEALISLLIEHGDEIPLPDYRTPVELAFDLHEEVKSRGLLADLSLLPLPLPPGVPEDLIKEEHLLRIALRRTLFGRTALAPWGRSEQEAQLLTGLTDRLAELTSRIGRHHPEYARLRVGRCADAAEARKLVDRHAPAEGMVLASYFVGESRTFCFVLASGEQGMRAYTINAGRQQLQAMADDTKRRINGDPKGFPPLRHIRAEQPRKLAALAKPAAELLPFQNLLNSRQLLCIAPHGPLAILHTHALPLRDGRYVTAQAAVVHTPSLSALRYLMAAEPGPDNRRLLSVGAAAREDDKPEMYEQTSLPESNGWEITRLSGLAATPLSVANELEQHAVALLTCHGYADPADPDDSGLILTGGRTRGSRNVDTLNLPESLPYLLRPVDISTPKRTPHTVVLQACSAGWNDPGHHGEDFTGLTRAFFREGTRTLLAPVCNVHRDSSAELLGNYLRHLTVGEPSWKALWAARRRMLADTQRPYLAHPYHWGSVIALGDWR